MAKSYSSEQIQTNSIVNDRRKRINRIKKIIVITVIVLILVPIIMCILLLAKVSSLQSQIDNLLTMKQSGEITVVYEDGQARLTKKDIYQVTQPVYTDNDVNQDNKEVPVKVEDDITKNGKYVYLTFDDGPSDNTQKILDILDKYGIKATFFVVGKSDEKSLDRYKLIAEAGHTLGIHSYSHDYDDIYSSLEAFIQDTQSIKTLVEKTTGETIRFYRFPGGSSTTTANVDMKILFNYLNENELVYFDWNVSSGDGSGTLQTKDAIINNVITGVRNYDNSVVLMHDLESKTTTIEALPELIQTLLRDGYTFKGIDETTQLVQHQK